MAELRAVLVQRLSVTELRALAHDSGCTEEYVGKVTRSDYVLDILDCHGRRKSVHKVVEWVDRRRADITASRVAGAWPLAPVLPREPVTPLPEGFTIEYLPESGGDAQALYDLLTAYRLRGDIRPYPRPPDRAVNVVGAPSLVHLLLLPPELPDLDFVKLIHHQRLCPASPPPPSQQPRLVPIKMRQSEPAPPPHFLPYDSFISFAPNIQGALDTLLSQVFGIPPTERIGWADAKFHQHLDPARPGPNWVADKLGFECYPFGHCRAEDDPSLPHCWIALADMPDLFDDTPALVMGRKGAGKSTLAYGLVNECWEQGRHLPVYIADPPVDAGPASLLQALAQTAIRACAPYLIGYQHPLRHTLAHHWATISAWLKGAEQFVPGQPLLDKEALIEIMSQARPPAFKSTWLIVDLAETALASARATKTEALQALLNLAPVLAAKGLILKLFLAPADDHPLTCTPDVRRYDIRWNEASLAALLDRSFEAMRRPGGLTEFYDPGFRDTPEADALPAAIIQKALASTSPAPPRRLCELCHALFELIAPRDPQPYITLADAQWLLTL